MIDEPHRPLQTGKAKRSSKQSFLNRITVEEDGEWQGRETKVTPAGDKAGNTDLIFGKKNSEVLPSVKFAPDSQNIIPNNTKTGTQYLTK